MRKRAYRLADQGIPGSFKSAMMNYIAIDFERDQSGHFVVHAGTMKSKPFLSESAAESEYDRLSHAAVITHKMLEGYVW